MKALWQIPAILAITAFISLGYNQIRAKTLPLVCPWSESISGSSFSEYVSIVSIDEAAALFSNNDVVFIDARPESHYDEGHIRGALCLPWQQAEEKCFQIIENIPPDKNIITYCDGATCDLCDKLAVFLCDLGFDQVQALINGWTVWNQNKLPVDLPETQLIMTKP
ncbi:MAG: rhodanese-like domain-containing protein [Desulfobacteraceae bacterium]|nr:rhodanese-like domain-containing protein [Desulfobacteraceae bacterium]MBC2757174.1 rhodanese-like domain-containing protein [Desulfobacteraceae bacterium]